MQQSKRPLAKPPVRPIAQPVPVKPPAIDLDDKAPAKAMQRTTTVTSVAVADASSIDAQLDALATRTTVEDLARRGKKNLKTLSERQLKEWIREALRRVISTTTSDAEQERLLAATRAELNSLMSEAGNANAEHEALQAQIARLTADLAVLAAERDVLARRIAELEQRLDQAADQIADAEMAAATAGDPDIEVVESLRAELGTAYSRLSASEHERAGLQKTLGARLIATSEVAAAVLELDRSCYGGLHLQQAQSNAAGDTAAFYADEDAARATAEALVRDLAGLRGALATAAPAVADESLAGDRQRVADLAARLSTAADPAVLATALRERDEARAQVDAAKRTVARMIAQADPQEAQNTTARISRAESESKLAAERLAGAETRLAAAERRAQDAAAACSQATAEAERLRAGQGAAHEAGRAAAGRAEALSAEVARLTRELSTARAAAAEATALSAECDRLAALGRTADERAAAATTALASAQERWRAAEASCRSVELSLAQRSSVPATTAVEGPAERTTDRLSHADGSWRWTWSDDGILRRSAFHGAWGEEELVAAAPDASVLHLPDGAWAAWRDADGSGCLASPDGTVHELGPIIAQPGLVRGTGTPVPFVGVAAPGGVVQVVDADGLAEELSSRLGGPTTVGRVCAWWWAQEDSRHLAYRDAQGGIHELLELDGAWYHASLTGHTGCPPAAGDPVGYAPGNHEHVLYRAVDGHLHELCFHAGRWLDHDLTAVTGCPAISGQPSGAYIAGHHHIAFRAGDGSLHLLRLGLDWRHTALPRLGCSDGDPVLSGGGTEGAIAWSDGGRWRWARFADDPASANPEPLG